VDHHRPWTSPEARDFVIEFLARRLPIEKLAEQDLRMDIGNDGAPGFIATAVGEDDAGRLLT